LLNWVWIFAVTREGDVSGLYQPVFSGSINPECGGPPRQDKSSEIP
jgi:hypothetical protein